MAVIYENLRKRSGFSFISKQIVNTVRKEILNVIKCVFFPHLSIGVLYPDSRPKLLFIPYVFILFFCEAFYLVRVKFISIFNVIHTYP